MSHEISEIDRQEGTTMGWHNLTKVFPVILLGNCFLALWDVTKRKLFRHLSNGAQQETNSCEVVCTDNENIVIGKPVDCDSYSLLTNKQFLAIVQSALDSIRGATVASVGSVCRRARIFVSLSLPRLEDIGNAEKTFRTGVPAFSLNAAGREFQFFLNFLSSHDKTSPFIVNLSTVCTVCNNTFTMNMLDSKNEKLRIVIRHTKNMADAIEDVQPVIDAFFTTAQRFAETMDALSRVPICQSDARNFFAGFLTDKEDNEDKTASEIDEMSTKTLNRVERITELFVNGKGNTGKNLADVFSAITDFFSHESAGGFENAEKQFASSEFGRGQTMKALAFVILQNDKRIAKTIANGAKVLAA